MNKTTAQPEAGLVLVRSENSNFNADESGSPRRLPDEKGTIYSTDKALKYAIRKYLKEELNEDIFVWRRLSDEYKPLNIKETYEDLFGESANKSEVAKNLLSRIDVRLFGVTYPEKNRNVAITGPAQISYGKNISQENAISSNQILSPYQNSNKEDSDQTSMGSEYRALEAHYGFDFSINPSTLHQIIADLDLEKGHLQDEDIDSFYEALRKGVTTTNSTTMIGSEVEMVLRVKDKSALFLHNMKNLLEIKKEGKDRKIDIHDVVGYITDTCENPEVIVYYHPSKTSISYGERFSVVEKHLITGRNL